VKDGGSVANGDLSLFGAFSAEIDLKAKIPLRRPADASKEGAHALLAVQQLEACMGEVLRSGTGTRVLRAAEAYHLTSACAAMIGMPSGSAFASSTQSDARILSIKRSTFIPAMVCLPPNVGHYIENFKVPRLASFMVITFFQCHCGKMMRGDGGGCFR